MSSSPDPSTNRPEPLANSAKNDQAHQAEHPPLFFQLCAAVLCERWAAFMVISTAALMLCERCGFTRADALRIWGAFSAASYFGSLPGGYILDRSGSRARGLWLSTLLLLLGYLVLSLPYRRTVLVALGLLVVGHSLYKPSTQRLLSSIHQASDISPERAQIMVYIAANLGATAGSVLAGLLLRDAGWSVTYGCAALMMSLGGVLLSLQSGAQHPVSPSAKFAIPPNETQDTISTPLPTALIAGLTLAMFLFTLCTAQAEGALLLWAKDRIDRTCFGFEVPIAWFMAFPAALVLLLAPIQLALMPIISRKVETSKLVALGLLAAALSFVVLLPTTLWQGHLSMGWLVASLSFFVMAELLIAPLGISLLLRNTPKQFVGVVTGLWYGAGALGYYAGGEIGALWSRWPTRNVLLFLTLLTSMGALVLHAVSRRTAR